MKIKYKFANQTKFLWNEYRKHNFFSLKLNCPKVPSQASRLTLVKSLLATIAAYMDSHFYFPNQ